MLEMLEYYDNVNVTCSCLILTKTQAYWSLARNYRSGGLWFQLQLESHREGNKLLFFAGFLPIRSKFFFIPWKTSKKLFRPFEADIVKQIWAELPKHMSTPVAPLDEEMLSELAKVPAVVDGASGLLYWFLGGKVQRGHIGLVTRWPSPIIWK